jgi:chromodomain-helicase-DNA-binding protein 7
LVLCVGAQPRGGARRGASTAGNPYKFDCLLTTYDTMRNEGTLLGAIDWSVCVADEAHRLKALDSFTSIAMRQDYRFKWLLMLTGTPVQNNLNELFGLLHLLDAVAFPSWADFQEQFCPGGTLDAARAPALAAALRPYLLRRMKEDVEDIPEKEEVVVWVEMTADQRAYYKALHEAKIHVLLAGASRKNMPNSRNLLMELRHCCNHPFLLNGIEADFTRKRREVRHAVRLLKA